MLELKNIKKSYKTGDFIQHALKGVNLRFRKNEFVAILGPSGSGKTTLLNIIGGLDRYDSGDLIINGKSTSKFKNNEWDAYRNNCIGFIFQSYNLIGHISVLANVEMGMTLSGISANKRKKKAMQVLKKVGLEKHAHKKPNQLSGGQMQRVAIARALANNPDIILADEPTGALDSKTSIQIMELIKEIAKDKLVIMVTHNPDLAKEYASRIVEFKDGNLINDSNPIDDDADKNEIFKIKRTAMSFLTALKLSFNNIRTKKGRTLLTAFASSIGIIGIALILALSNGFDIQIDIFEKDTLSSMPIMISEQAMNIDEDSIQEIQKNETENKSSYTNKKFIYPQKPIEETMTHTNNLTEEYIDYINNINNNLISGISYTRATNLNLISKYKDEYKQINANELGFSTIPTDLEGNSLVLKDNYDLLYGNLPNDKNELLIIADSKNRISTEILEALGIDSDADEIKFENIINKEIKLILNNNYYKEMEDHYIINSNFEDLYNYDDAITLKVTGIIRGKEDKKTLTANSSGLVYSDELLQYIIEQNMNSNIVKTQKDKDYNVLTGESFKDESEKDTVLAYLGADTVPAAINIYPKNFDTKEKITDYLDEYNNDKSNDDKILYNDLGKMISSLSNNIMDAITIVLIAFSAISLVVSSIMIGIITYISVLERTKEIGILRALGARKKDIARVFNAETFIIGICSGSLGILIARILVIPTNIIIKNLTELPNVAQLNPIHALILIIISILLTMIGGYIPAKLASKKDPVESLRTE